MRPTHRLLLPIALLTALLAACATPSPGPGIEPPTTGPLDEDDEDARVGTEIGIAQRGALEEGNYPEQPIGAEPCMDRQFMGSPDGDRRPPQMATPCWKALIQATPRVAEDRERARQRMDLRRQSEGAPLIEAEQAACQGLTETEVALSPFYFKEDIIAVAPIEEGEALLGASISFDANVPNLTAGRMEQIVRCHLARSEVICDPTSVEYCPLVLQGVRADVDVEGERIVIELRGESREAAEELLQRARKLAPEGAAM